jgi:hypothetical protein
MFLFSHRSETIVARRAQRGATGGAHGGSGIAIQRQAREVEILTEAGEDGYSARLSDFLNSSEKNFLALPNAVVGAA